MKSIYPTKDMWGEGPWQNEPDREEWVDSDSGYHCIVRRSYSLGAWCGYVGIPKGHPCHGKDAWAAETNEVQELNVHGGVTYSAGCDGEPGHGICHKVEEGDDHVWWLGFDCGHGGDISPAMESVISSIFLHKLMKVNYPGLSYKTLDYVKNETTKLAYQLKAMGS